MIILSSEDATYSSCIVWPQGVETDREKERERERDMDRVNVTQKLSGLVMTEV